MIDQISKLSALAQHLLQSQGFLSRQLIEGKAKEPKQAPQVAMQFNFGKIKSERMSKGPRTVMRRAAKQIKPVQPEEVVVIE